MKLLLFDTVLDGHHTDYLTYLIEYWHEHKIEGELLVVTPRGLSGQFPNEISCSTQIQFIEIAEREIAEFKESSIVGRSFAGWNLFTRYAKQYRPDHAILMYFDLFQLGLGLGKKSPCPVSGIYFRPNFHQHVSRSGKEKWMTKIKKLILSRALANPAFVNLYCLDKTAVPTIQAITGKDRVLPLSDPVREYAVTNEQTENLRMTLGIEESRKVFLLFGYLDDRKGIEPILDSIALLNPIESKQMALILAGPISDQYRTVIEEKIESLNTDIQILCHFQTLKGAAIQTLFSLSDFVLTLYQKHVGMSSIVVRAALSQKPLISSDFGYLGNLVSSQQLGTTVDSSSPAAICAAFQRALRGTTQFDRAAAEKLAKENTAQAFAEQILSEILEKN
ncbi:glycosyltransferase [Persicitalea jodogahamensis]|uniref:Glycosyl transferase family 1 domain-containing protein n=1 Tax=Persicitalea jodogahamensis TaxID=402147 RepID=A0A8J3D6B1_9BACT|nr:glycosyltransferase [Persicitalea jodogahamensis]GHB80802.1 hypothetical protein GCM10007390_39200 [Persicitalea jodogahamensis]